MLVQSHTLCRCTVFLKTRSDLIIMVNRYLYFLIGLVRYSLAFLTDFQNSIRFDILNEISHENRLPDQRIPEKDFLGFHLHQTVHVNPVHSQNIFCFTHRWSTTGLMVKFWLRVVLFWELVLVQFDLWDCLGCLQLSHIWMTNSTRILQNNVIQILSTKLTFYVRQHFIQELSAHFSFWCGLVSKEFSSLTKISICKMP